MSRFLVVEYRLASRWRQWVLTDRESAAIQSARSLKAGQMREGRHVRVVRVDTDAGTVTVCWEGRR